MSNNLRFIGVILVIILGGLLVIGNKNIREKTEGQNPKSIKHFGAQKISKASPVKKQEQDGPIQIKPVLELNKYTFERYILLCFQSEPCKFSEDPFNLYSEYKKAGNKKEINQLIAFLRKEMQRPELRDSYKDPLKKMIMNFYPKEEIDFQMAAYYAYLGDLESSRKIYLELYKKAETNSKIYVPSKLNIANVCFDLKRYKEARKYYQEALEQFTSGEFKLADGESDTIDYINERLKTLEAI